jgi:hypothetical protein
MRHPVSGQSIDLSVSKHVYCCGEDGCLLCSADIERAREDGADLSHLREWLTNRPADHQAKLQERFRVAVAQEG